jgi:digeranylgeranylglycerophospholipid reductase
LCAAKAAALRGANVVVVEREAEIGWPVRTTGGASIDMMRRLSVPSTLYHEIRTVRFRSPNREAVLQFDRPSLCVLDVTETYRHLAEQARAAGAEVLTGRTVKRITRSSPNGFVIDVSLHGGADETLRPRAVIDASGYRAVIAKQLGVHQGFGRFGVGAEVDLLDPRIHQDEVVLHVGRNIAPHGYGWVFPWGQSRVRAGIGLLHSDTRLDPRSRLDELLASSDLLNIDLSGTEGLERHFGLIPAEGLADALVGDGVLVVGDAAGQASPIAGVGIALAMSAGLMAGQVAAGAIEGGNSSRPKLMAYERAFRRRYSRRLSIGMALNGSIARWGDRDWDSAVEMVSEMNPEVVGDILVGDLPWRHLVPWIARRPHLWPRAIRVAGRLAMIGR